MSLVAYIFMEHVVILPKQGNTKQANIENVVFLSQNKRFFRFKNK
jgi:hypothetical protein